MFTSFWLGKSLLHQPELVLMLLGESAALLWGRGSALPDFNFMMACWEAPRFPLGGQGYQHDWHDPLKLSFFVGMGQTQNIKKLNTSFSWLVVWLPCFIFPYIGNNHPNWLSYFSEGFKPPTSLVLVRWVCLKVVQKPKTTADTEVVQDHVFRWEWWVQVVGWACKICSPEGLFSYEQMEVSCKNRSTPTHPPFEWHFP